MAQWVCRIRSILDETETKLRSGLFGPWKMRHHALPGYFARSAVPKYAILVIMNWEQDELARPILPGRFMVLHQIKFMIVSFEGQSQLAPERRTRCLPRAELSRQPHAEQSHVAVLPSYPYGEGVSHRP